MNIIYNFTLKNCTKTHILLNSSRSSILLYSKNKRQYADQKDGSKKKGYITSSFGNYIKEHYSRFEQEYPEAKGLVRKLIPLIAEEWKKLPPYEKQKYKPKTRTDVFKEEEQIILETLSKKIKRAPRKKPSPPTYPTSIYMSYIGDNFARVYEENPDKDAQEIMKILAEMYRNASEEELEKYKKKFEEEKRIYDEEVKKFKNSKIKNVRTAFNFFVKEKFSEVQKQTGKKPTDVVVMLCKQFFEEMSDEEKHKYYVLEMEDRLRNYREKIQKRNENLKEE